MRVLSSCPLPVASDARRRRAASSRDEARDRPRGPADHPDRGGRRRRGPDRSRTR